MHGTPELFGTLGANEQREMDMRLSPFLRGRSELRQRAREFQPNPEISKVDNPYDNQDNTPTFITSGAFLISNNMAASRASSSGLVTPISELPPSAMGEGDIANGGDLQQQLPMDYFDFDLSSFASDGVLTSTGINLGVHGEEDEQINNLLDTNRGMESNMHDNGNGANAPTPAAAMWGESDQRLSGNSAESNPHPTTAQSNQQLHEQVSSVRKIPSRIWHLPDVILFMYGCFSLSCFLQQLAQFHMQSPAIFAQLNGQHMNHNPQSINPYQSTPGQPDTTATHWSNKSIAPGEEALKRVSFSTHEATRETQKPYTFVQPLSHSAMPTPGKQPRKDHAKILHSYRYPKTAQSGEMMPNIRTELVSPLPLGNGLEGGDVAGEYTINERGDVSTVRKRDMSRCT